MTAVAERVTTTASLPALLLRNAHERGGRVAMRKKHLGRWREYTWDDYLTRVTRVGNGLLQLGVVKGDRVAIHSLNRPAWLFFDLAVQGIGAITVGVYPTSPPPDVQYLVGNSESVVLVAEDEEQLDKAMAVRTSLPNLRHIIVVNPRGVKCLDDPMVMTMAELDPMHANHPDRKVGGRDRRCVLVLNSEQPRARVDVLFAELWRPCRQRCGDRAPGALGVLR